MLATTIEQSQHLLDLGLNSKTADMCLTWVNNQWNEVADNADRIREIQICNACEDNGYKPEDVNVIPAWSLGALLEVLPDEIRTHKGRFDAKYRFYWELRKNWILYSCLDEDYSPLIEFDGENNLEAVFNMVVWLLENGYIKNEK